MSIERQFTNGKVTRSVSSEADANRLRWAGWKEVKSESGDVGGVGPVVVEPVVVPADPEELPSAPTP